MALKSKISIILMLSTTLMSSIAVNVEAESTHPIVGDWEAAINSEGLVRIPLQNPHGHTWFIN